MREPSVNIEGQGRMPERPVIQRHCMDSQRIEELLGKFHHAGPEPFLPSVIGQPCLEAADGQRICLTDHFVHSANSSYSVFVRDVRFDFRQFLSPIFNRHVRRFLRNDSNLSTNVRGTSLPLIRVDQLDSILVLVERLPKTALNVAVSLRRLVA